MAKTNQNKNNSSEINNHSLFNSDSCNDFTIKINFQNIAEISTEIVKCRTAISKLQKMATKLANLKSGLVDISISIPELKEPKKEIPGANNVGVPIAFFCSIDDLKNMEQYTAPKGEYKNYQKQEITDSVHPELALIMFETMKKHYENRLIFLLGHFVNEVELGTKEI